MTKTTKYLRCHTAGTKRDITEGKRYEIVDTAMFLGNNCYVIIDDAGDRSAWPIEIDDEGESYRDWFTLETDEPITLLPDESLGGVLREYREVKRKANVGETVKVIASDSAENGVVGSIGVCTRNDQFCDESIDTTLTHDEDGFIDVVRAEYVVLEPTDILRIGAERFRMVDRKAAVGERVIVTKDGALSVSGHGRYYNCGDLAAVKLVGDCGDIYADLTGNAHYYMDGQWRVGPDQYAVLEPVESEALTAVESAPLSALPLADQYAENITVLTRKIAQLEEDLRVAREDIVLIEEGVIDDIKTLEKHVNALEVRILALETDSAVSVVKVAEGHVDNIERAALPTFAKTPKEAVLSPQQVRDEVVERAVADVSDLRKFSGKKIPNDFVSFWPKTELPHAYIAMHTVEFVVNSAKRTVAVIIRCTEDGLTTRGIAKCAPGETFNAHIGRAIALYRALGLNVPAEYLTCPQPETVRVGDVVTGGVVYAVRPTHRTVGVSDPQAFVSVDLGYTYIDGKGREVWEHLHYATITDDSREGGGGISASPSALKGAA